MKNNMVAKIIEMQNMIQGHLEGCINVYLGVIIGILASILGLNIYLQTKRIKKL